MAMAMAMAGCSANRNEPGSRQQIAGIAASVEAITASVASVEASLEQASTATSSTSQNAPHGRNTAITTSIAVTGGGAVATLLAVGVLAWRYYVTRRMLIAVTRGVNHYAPARDAPIKTEHLGPAADELGVRPALRAFAARHGRGRVTG